MSRFGRLGVVMVLLASVPGLADEAKKLKGSKTVSMPKLDLGLSFEPVPKGEGLRKAAPAAATEAGRESAATRFEVLRVVHARRVGSGEGLQARQELTQVAAQGTPRAIEAFTTVVRLRRSGPQPTAAVTVTLKDPRGDTFLEAKGQVPFLGKDEAEWAVDWAPSMIRHLGDYTLLVSVNSEQVLSQPLKVVDPSR
jgi:hypothetical protein